MKQTPPSTILTADDGSTEPEIDRQYKAVEASQIRKFWITRNGGSDSAASFDASCLCRHKSLVLSLAAEDYSQACENSNQPIVLDEFCRRYHGLGDLLEHSIVRRLEVEEVISENPELLGSWHFFGWPEPGKNFLQFQVIEELGRGRFGRVYLCAQQNLGGKTAVVKIESGKLVSEPALLGKLQHPNVMPISWADYDASLDASFFCMPFLGRSTFADLVQLAFHEGLPASAAVVEQASKLWLTESDALTLESSPQSVHFSSASPFATGIVKLANDVAKSLAFVHDQGIVHGDIKPSNILLSATSQPFLMDFNLGRSHGSSSSRLGGTPAYMAPEQLRLFVQVLPSAEIGSGVATDIYSFGAVLYELLTGKPPLDPPVKRKEFVAAVHEMVDLQKSGFADVRKLNPLVDRQLARLVHDCLAFAPADRPASMGEVSDRLAQCDGMMGGVRRYAHQKPRQTRLVAAVVACVFGMSSLTYWSRPPLAQQLYSRSVSAHSSGDLAESIALANRVLVLAPDFSTARLHRARCHAEMHEFAAAHADLRLLSRTSENPSILAYYAYNLNKMDNPDAAALWHQKALDKGLRNAAVLNNLGVSILLQSKPVSLSARAALARPLLEEALLIRSDSAVIRINVLWLYGLLAVSDPENARAAAAEHIQWLSSKMSDHAQVRNSIYQFYLILAKHGHIDNQEVISAQEHYLNAPIRTSIPRFVDPLPDGDSL